MNEIIKSLTAELSYMWEWKARKYIQNSIEIVDRESERMKFPMKH